MNELFTIGGFCFRVVAPEEVFLPENFMKFRGGDAPRYTYTISVTADFPAPEGTVLTRREDLLVLGTDTGECRYIGVNRPYACYLETAPDAARIFLAPDQVPQLYVDPMAVSLFALERRMLDRDALIFHCAYVEYRGEAILFSAPSETGKTTQANLWEKYRGARTVNGDRGLLQKHDGRWCVRGWPVCGSSGVCHVKDLPIRAIVMLSQAPQDRAELLAPMKAFTQVYSQLTVNRWNRGANLKAMELEEDLIRAVPVFHLACTMEETAVESLEAALGKAGAL